MTLQFSEITAEKPVFEEVSNEYQKLFADWAAAADSETRLAVVGAWDDLRRRLSTWHSLVELRFEQDTTNEEYKADREYADELSPKLTELAVEMMNCLLKSDHRSELDTKFGPQATALWETEVLSFDPTIKEELVAESKLQMQFSELHASAALEFQGETTNLEGIKKFSQVPEREIRHGSTRVLWDWFAENGEQLDAIFDRQVQLRDMMAKKLGYADYVELGYKQMSRIDYDRENVEFYRAQVREHVVPLCTAICDDQQQRLELDRLCVYDEPLFEPQGNPKPQGDHDWMIERAKEMFDGMGGGLGEFFRLMADGDFMDLKNRSTKAGGGFCTSFASYGMPYVFANFNGTKGDVEVFTHEIGHAYQCYSSRQQPLFDYLWPTYESCEIHSMGLEFLTWGHMDKFFGEEGGERFRKIHLAQSLLFLPYGVAVDHFQHLVYENPDATPSERHTMWRDMEKIYMPHRDWDDIAYGAKGGRWQLQRHIYLRPFYYIDYTLALCCALQFWLRSEEDFDAAMNDYVALCARGGEAPFQELATSAGLISPFAEDCLANVATHARGVLGV